jgi:HSP20 family molecular chaperone IbpA
MDTGRETYHAVTWRVRSNVWRPPTDMFETETSVIVKVEVAGVRDEDIEVAVRGKLLSVNGIRSDSAERRAYHQMEIPYGKFSVDIELPVAVNIDNATAEYKGGFLIIHLPKEKLDT